MFEQSQARTMRALVFNFFEVTYYATVRKVRKTHGNAVLSIALSVFQSLVFIAAFYFMFSILGTRAAAIRGNFMMYLMSGIFLYLTHIQTVRQMMSAEGSTSSMMQHAPMNTLVSIVSTALSILYTQTISLFCVLLLIHGLVEPVEIANWEGAFRMYLLAWGTGVTLGIIFMAVRPWAPDAVQIISMIYIRANMIFSGKMFVANMMPSLMLPAFEWNPLFHVIDQARGHIFVNYFPHVTNAHYPFYFTLVALLIGMMLEHRTRKFASVSWDAKR
ncbi:ABC transporter permease [Hasllibacter sp. MH4015]|uniref:ABC transporter permease n=1 Tax=Hasllibacter sp. MH4015 TaxID=2854029 RepID=UPI001CD5AA29|nr:ABC transporter permease [Hasllibacter sp. MH4015]